MVYPLILLFPPEATDFSTNGLGSLGEAISCLVTEEANGSFELELVYPLFGRRYKDITLRSIIFTKPNPLDPPQAFRVYEISRPMDGQVTFYAEHISYDLSGYPVKPFSATTAVEAMVGLKTYSAIANNFTFWTNKTTNGEFRIDAPASIRACLGGSEGSILDIYKGEYKFDNFEVRLYESRGIDNGVTIRYGKNLTDLTQDENNANVYTGVMPYWFDQNDGTIVQATGDVVPTEGTYNYTRVLVVDASSDFQEQPSSEDLVTWAKNYISNNNVGKPEVSLDVSFEQLERFKEYETLTLLEQVALFDTVHVEFPDLNVSSTAKVSKTVYDCINHKYESVTIGEVRASISDTVTSQGDTVEEALSGGGISAAVQKATNWITNGHGYMVAVKNEAGQWEEICSLDDPDINRAVNVWRWNNGGFGHSNHGYNGPYDTAITQDGHMVADFITSGRIESKNGAVYFDLDNNEMACSRLVSPESVGGNRAMVELEYVGDAVAGLTNLNIINPATKTVGGTVFTTGQHDIGIGADTNSHSNPAMISIIASDPSFNIGVTMDTYSGLFISITNNQTGYSANLIGNLNSSGKPTFSVDTDFIVSGKKPRAVQTETYGKRLLYAYETAEPMFGDVGRSEILSCGVADIIFDPIFRETVNTDDYYVFLQAESKGNVYVSERRKNGFVVEGDPGTIFSWVVYARQVDFPDIRLEEVT